MLIKELQVEIDSKSWPDEDVPIEISKMSGYWEANLFSALIHTALWTRPPTSIGLHLSDFWAWLRYSKAVDDNQRTLRLCKEWEDIDPHQKTILSDEFGVGFTTYLLCEKLGCIGFADTLYLQKHPDLAQYFLIRSSKKIGRSKSPDYISIDNRHDIYIIECKGTQSSYSTLKTSIKKGQEQKSSIALTSSSVKHSLVAGLFVPKYSATGSARIRIADPTWEDMNETIDTIPELSRNNTFLQIVLAKHFSLAGLPILAQTLMDTNPLEIDIPDSARTYIEEYLNLDQTEERARILFDSETDNITRFSSAFSSERSLRFSARIPKEIEIFLRTSLNSREEASTMFRTFFERLRQKLVPTSNEIIDNRSNTEIEWSSNSVEDKAAFVSSPFEFSFCLEERQ